MSDGIKPLPETLEIVKDGPLRKFADSGIQDSMARILAAVPDDKRGAVVGVLTKDGIKSMAVIKLPKGWSLMGALERDWDGAFRGEMALGCSF